MHLNTGGAQPLAPPTAHERVRIQCGEYDAFDARLDERVGAWGRAPEMAARLEVDIGGGSGRRSARGG